MIENSPKAPEGAKQKGFTLQYSEPLARITAIGQCVVARSESSAASSDHAWSADFMLNH